MPHPTPRVKSKLFILLEATKYSDEKIPVPAKSLKPKAKAGITSVSFISFNLMSKLLSLKV